MFKLATIVLGLAILIYIICDLYANSIQFDYKSLSKNLIFLSLALYLLAIIIKLLGKLFKPFMQNKCIKCGEPIPKGHIYCSKHERELADETRKTLEKTWSKRNSS
jgi:hypothetical protein